MNHRITAGLLFLVSLITILLGYFLMYPELTKWCLAVGFNCFGDNWTFGVGQPLFWSTRWLPPLFLVLIFVRKEVFAAWWKVILWFAVPALLLIVISPPLPAFLTPDRTQMTDLMVKIIVVVSLAIILWKYWRLYRLKSTKPAKAA